MATPSAARAADFIIDKFKLWFGKSELKYKDTGRPISFFHGPVTFGISDPATGDSQNWTFNDDRRGKNTGSPMAALGNFFTRDRDEAGGYSRGSGNVKGVYLRMERPKIMWPWQQLPEFDTCDDFRAYSKRAHRSGRVGRYLVLK